MPNIDLVGIAKIALKLLIIALLATLIVTFVGHFATYLITVIQHLTGALSTVNGVNLGYFANAIGLVTFLNSLMQSLYIAGSILISGVISILTFKYGIRLYNSLMKM